MKLKRIFIMFIFVFISFLALTGCVSGGNNEWDKLDGGGTGDIQDNADTGAIDDLKNQGNKIIKDIDENQTNVDCTDSIEVKEAIKISSAGEYVLSGIIEGQINVKAEGVKLFLNNVTINNLGKKVISSDFDLIIVLNPGTDNYINNTGTNAAEANAISGSGKITINGGGKLTIDSTKSGIKADGIFYGLGGELVIVAGVGHGINADSVILMGGKVTVNGAAKDGIHAEIDDKIIAEAPIFDLNRGYVYICDGVSLNVNYVYGDGIQADTFVLIEGGNIVISTLPTFIRATSSEGCYKLLNGVYSKVAKDDSRNYSNLYQLSQSSKGIKVGEIDYEVDSAEYKILENTAYSLIVSAGDIEISSTDDGLHTNSGDLLISGGKIKIKTVDDGVSADKNVKITGGELTILTSYEGIEGETIEISGGINIITATDDGINASNDDSQSVQRTKCYIKITGGRIFVNAQGDGIDSNGGVLISGGELYVYGPVSNGDAALDSETGIIVKGGILIAVGSSGMVETPTTNSIQYIISINLSSSISGKIQVKSDNEVIADFDPISIFGVTKNYQSIVISIPNFYKGEKYSVHSGTTATNVTINGIITKIGQAAGPGGPGGPGGRK